MFKFIFWVVYCRIREINPSAVGEAACYLKISFHIKSITFERGIDTFLLLGFYTVSYTDLRSSYNVPM